MKVILKEDIKGVGKKDQVISASDGYARNFLFPKKLAVPADKGNMDQLKAKQSSEEHRKAVEKEEAKKIAEKMKKIELRLTVKAGENGKVFGSVTGKEIAEQLEKKHQIKIDKKKIAISEPIKIIGIFQVDIKLYDGVIGKLKVNIVGD